MSVANGVGIQEIGLDWFSSHYRWHKGWEGKHIFSGPRFLCYLICYLGVNLGKGLHSYLGILNN
jgi:hypothetical protein